MESLSLENDNMIKDKRNLFRVKKELNYTAFIDIRNLFRLEKETKAIKDKTLKDIKNLFGHEKENNYKSVRVNNYWSNNYIEHGRSGNRNKSPSVEEYLIKLDHV